METFVRRFASVVQSNVRRTLASQSQSSKGPMDYIRQGVDQVKNAFSSEDPKSKSARHRSWKRRRSRFFPPFQLRKQQMTSKILPIKAAERRTPRERMSRRPNDRFCDLKAVERPRNLEITARRRTHRAATVEVEQRNLNRLRANEARPRIRRRATTPVVRPLNNPKVNEREVRRTNRAATAAVTHRNRAPTACRRIKNDISVRKLRPRRRRKKPMDSAVMPAVRKLRALTVAGAKAQNKVAHQNVLQAVMSIGMKRQRIKLKIEKRLRHPRADQMEENRDK